MIHAAQIAGLLSAAASAFFANLNMEPYAGKMPVASSERQETDCFSAEWDSFMLMLQKESPGLQQKIREIPSRKKMECLLKVLNTGIRPASDVRRKPLTETAKREVYPAKLIHSNSIFYARLDALDPAVLKQLQDDVTLSSRLANKPVGTILDLRNATSGDYSLVDDFLTLFIQKQQKTEYFQTIPVVVLCDTRTAGAPQLFAALTGQSKRGITMGRPCEHGPFPEKTVFFNGKKWLIPIIGKKDWMSIAPVPFVPAIQTPPCQQIEFKKIGKVDLMREDPEIRRACDLIQSLNAIRK